MGYKEAMDGNTAAAHISYAFTEVAGIFPITPSSPMAEYVDEWAAKGRKNLFGQPVKVVEMQSEGGAAGTVHGSLQAGALTTTYTASQGLLLMIPNMYKIAGEFLPGVFHVSARTLSAHALSIFGDHSDVMGCRMTGFALLAASSPQEVMDLGAVAHLSAIKGRVPFLHYFDGFRTSHEIQKIDVLEYGDMAKLLDWGAVDAFRRRSLNPAHPCTRGTTVNPDVFFQTREAGQAYFDAIPGIVEAYMKEINHITGRDYRLFDYYGAPDADRVVISMCSVSDVVKEVCDKLNAEGDKVGMVNVHLYRPFSTAHFLAALPKTVKKIAALDRTKEPGSLGEPLYQDVVTALREGGGDAKTLIVGGRYGLSSKDTTPDQIAAVYRELAKPAPKNGFTIGIKDDVYGTSLDPVPGFQIEDEGTKAYKIWGLGSDGTVGANKNSIKIIGENTEGYTQAYFVYDSKKSGGLTQSHLRVSKNPIRATYLVTAADLVACHNPSYVDKYDLVRELKQGGIFLLNCLWKDAGELDAALPDAMKKALADKDAQLYVIDAIGIARGLGLGNRTNTVLQAAFFKLTGMIELDLAVKEMKDAIQKTYFVKRGQEVVDRNNAAVDKGLEGLVKIEIPAHWKDLKPEAPDYGDVPAFIKDIVIPVNRQEGDGIPVSVMKKHGTEDGSWMHGTTKYEKRGVAVDVPEWQIENCVQCGRCSFVCPHAAIRPALLDEAEQKAAPGGFETKKATGAGLDAYAFRIQVSPYDCTGCGSCAELCPAKVKALVMKPLAGQLQQSGNWDWFYDNVSVKKDAASGKSVKSSQFYKPYFEFSGACAGCAETPYIKLVTQLFGRKMYITNASGCSTAYGGSTPSTPYTADKEGIGPTWAMSLFEDNAEYAYGFLLGHEAIHSELAARVAELKGKGLLGKEADDYLNQMHDFEASDPASAALVEAVAKIGGKDPAADYILRHKDYLAKKSFWAFGGDGWAYDIGFGGLDHVLAQGRDINVLVMDTEVYSNTGGQSSKATTTGAVAKFAAAGKEVKKKDLGLMMTGYGYVYVAQVAMGYDPNQTLAAIREAEAYPGPSLIIAYCPCIEHGPKIGMGKSQEEIKRAVEAGYWHCWRYDPRKKEAGENPFTLDSKPPTGDIGAFMGQENRFASLALAYPERAEWLYAKAAKDAAERYETYKKLAETT
ncbi:MAG: pyruvate:ferredoxin (flavodoxin) oxidoreductase [Clostridiales Family XIII bacterium]|jgi:pyruvate-ferredoxin/flavodoxin oxidoreductase|nr:pyruvate:ferredoxin (flavodoxin) oxidoreductase [Clostridiales Family XIII bacterium]